MRFDEMTIQQKNDLLQECQSRPEGHAWINVAPGMDRCMRCGSEIFDLTDPPENHQPPQDDE